MPKRDTKCFFKKQFMDANDVTALSVNSGGQGRGRASVIIKRLSNGGKDARRVKNKITGESAKGRKGRAIKVPQLLFR